MHNLQKSWKFSQIIWKTMLFSQTYEKLFQNYLFIANIITIYIYYNIKTALKKSIWWLILMSKWDYIIVRMLTY